MRYPVSEPLGLCTATLQACALSTLVDSKIGISTAVVTAPPPIAVRPAGQMASTSAVAPGATAVRMALTSVGATLWRDRVDDEIARLGLGPRAPGQLSASERRVARLASQGLTHRQVAARLAISPKTVEAHLARAYAKLGIHSRAELGAVMTQAAR